MKTIDLRKLAHAVKVADTLSYTSASEQLHLSQSALTRSIQSLEAELDIKLFDRSKSGVKVSYDGGKVLAKARELLLHARTMELEIDQLKQAESGEIAFGVGPAMPCLFLPELLATTCINQPNLSVEVAIESGYRLQEMLREEKIEFFIADTNQIARLDPNLFSIEPLTAIKAGFFARKHHPLAEKSEIEPQELSEFTLVSPQYRQAFNRTSGLEDVGTSQRRILCNDLNTLRQIAIQTDAILIGISQMVKNELGSGQMCKLPVRKIESEAFCNVALVSLPARTPSTAAKRITAEICKLILSNGEN